MLSITFRLVDVMKSTNFMRGSCFISSSSAESIRAMNPFGNQGMLNFKGMLEFGGSLRREEESGPIGEAQGKGMGYVGGEEWWR